MRKIATTTMLLLGLIAALLIPGCSDSPTETTLPGTELQFNLGEIPLADGDGPLEVREVHDYDWYWARAQNQTYNSVSQSINGSTGGTLYVSNYFPGYSEFFKVQVPPGAYSGIRQIQLQVPHVVASGVVPVYQLHIDPAPDFFNEGINVTFDYSPFTGEGGFKDEERRHHVMWMNTDEDEFEPFWEFYVDTLNSTVTFEINHFSYWALDDPKNELE